MLTPCISWAGYIEKDGYGQISSNKNGTLRTARVVLEQKTNITQKIKRGRGYESPKLKGKDDLIYEMKAKLKELKTKLQNKEITEDEFRKELNQIMSGNNK